MYKHNTTEALTTVKWINSRSVERASDETGYFVFCFLSSVFGLFFVLLLLVLMTNDRKNVGSFCFVYAICARFSSIRPGSDDACEWGP